MTAHTRSHLRVQIDRQVRRQMFSGQRRVEFCSDCSNPMDVPAHWSTKHEYRCNGCRGCGRQTPVAARPA